MGEPESEPEVGEDHDDNNVSLDKVRLAQLQKDMEDAEKDAEENAGENGQNNTNNRLVIDKVTEQLGTLPEAVERINGLVEELGVKEELIRKLETELTTASDLANVANSKKEALKIENESLKEENKSVKSEAVNSRKLIKHQMTVNEKLVKEGADPGLVKRLKVSEEDLKNKSKALEASEKARKDLIKKVEEEVSKRGNLEADKERLTKVVDALTKITGKAGNEETAKAKTKCRDVDKPAGCPRAGSCKFLHPEILQSKDKKNIDCVHWMRGKCKYSDKDCHFKHSAEKKDTKVNTRKRSEDVEQTNESSQAVFLQSLAKTLAQGQAVETRPGSPHAWGMEGQRSTIPSWGMDGHRSVRPRMVTPDRSSRGMDGQGGYNSRPRSPQGMESQWSSRTFYNSQGYSPRHQESSGHYDHYRRQGSPSRGMEAEGQLGQEAVQLLTRFVQQQAERK